MLKRSFSRNEAIALAMIFREMLSGKPLWEPEVSTTKKISRGTICLGWTFFGGWRVSMKYPPRVSVVTSCPSSISSVAMENSSTKSLLGMVFWSFRLTLARWRSSPRQSMSTSCWRELIFWIFVPPLTKAVTEMSCPARVPLGVTGGLSRSASATSSFPPPPLTPIGAGAGAGRSSPPVLGPPDPGMYRGPTTIGKAQEKVPSSYFNGSV